MCLSRQTRGQRIGNYEQEYNDSISEDNSSNSDVSEKLTVGSFGSSSSQNMSVRTHGSHQVSVLSQLYFWIFRAHQMIVVIYS